MYTLSDYADIPRVIVDSQYAKSKGLIVKSQRLKNVRDIEDKLKAIPSDDPEWREKVTPRGMEKETTGLLPGFHAERSGARGVLGPKGRRVCRIR